MGILIYATWFIAQGGVTGPIALGVNVKGYLTQRLVLLPKWLVGGGGWAGASLLSMPWQLYAFLDYSTSERSEANS